MDGWEMSNEIRQRRPITVQIPEPARGECFEMCFVTCPLFRSIDGYKYCTGNFSEAKTGPLRPGRGCPWFEEVTS